MTAILRPERFQGAGPVAAIDSSAAHGKLGLLAPFLTSSHGLGKYLWFVLPSEMTVFTRCGNGNVSCSHYLVAQEWVKRPRLLTVRHHLMLEVKCRKQLPAVAFIGNLVRRRQSLCKNTSPCSGTCHSNVCSSLLSQVGAFPQIRGPAENGQISDTSREFRSHYYPHRWVPYVRHAVSNIEMIALAYRNS